MACDSLFFCSYFQTTCQILPSVKSSLERERGHRLPPCTPDTSLQVEEDAVLLSQANNSSWPPGKPPCRWIASRPWCCPHKMENKKCQIKEGGMSGKLPGLLERTAFRNTALQKGLKVPNKSQASSVPRIVQYQSMPLNSHFHPDISKAVFTGWECHYLPRWVGKPKYRKRKLLALAHHSISVPFPPKCTAEPCWPQ